MFIEIAELRDEPLHVHHTYNLGELAFEHFDAAIAAPVAVDFILTHKGLDLRFNGTLATTIRLKCTRCLKETARELPVRFDLFYAPHPRTTAGGEEIALKYEEMEVGFYDGVRFDVDPMIAEQIVLALPMKAVCGENCRGLCYTCGQDLNERPCGCKTEDVDSRMAVLLEFRKKTNT